MLELLKSNPGLTRQHLQIIACAGSGKTEFVSLRISCLIAEGLAKPRQKESCNGCDWQAICPKKEMKKMTISVTANA